MPDVIDELIKSALIGTSRGGPAQASPSGVVGEALASLPQRSPESNLLATAAVLTAYERAGRVPTKIEAEPVTPADADDLPACSPRAAHLLAVLLATPANTTTQHLTREWFTYVTSARQRVPHRLLPRVLDYAANHRNVRPLVAQSAGARGRWLVTLNNRWKLEGDLTPAATGDWDTGTRDQRRAILAHLRATQPAEGLARIQSTWNEDAAEDRATFVEALATGLSAADEPFLEAALDDKSKRVRAAAAQVLAGLPTSALVARMTERVAASLKFDPAQPAAVLKLKKPRPAKLEVELPPEPLPKDWERDGITEKPTEPIGPRQWWLLQALAAVPPTTWSQRWGATPPDLVDAAKRNKDFGDLILRGWSEAAIRHPDPKWIAPLVPEAGPRATALLAKLDPADRGQLVLGLLEMRKGAEGLVQILATLEQPLDPRAARVALGTAEAHVAATSRGYDYTFGQALDLLALRLPAELHDELAARWVGPQWEPHRTALDRFFQTLALRRDIKREFEP